MDDLSFTTSQNRVLFSLLWVSEESHYENSFSSKICAVVSRTNSNFQISNFTITISEKASKTNKIVSYPLQLHIVTGRRLEAVLGENQRGGRGGRGAARWPGPAHSCRRGTGGKDASSGWRKVNRKQSKCLKSELSQNKLSECSRLFCSAAMVRMSNKQKVGGFKEQQIEIVSLLTEEIFELLRK